MSSKTARMPRTEEKSHITRAARVVRPVDDEEASFEARRQKAVEGLKERAYRRMSLTQKTKLQLRLLGARTIAAIFAALAAGVLLFLAPEIGIGSAVAGAVFAVFAGILLRPHGPI